jgi:hypothetical protein
LQAQQYIYFHWHYNNCYIQNREKLITKDIIFTAYSLRV